MLKNTYLWGCYYNYIDSKFINMKNVDKDLGDFIADINELLEEYYLKDYEIEGIDLVQRIIPIEDELGDKKKKEIKSLEYEVRKISNAKLKIEIVDSKKK